MAAGIYDIIIDQGSDFSLEITVKDDANQPKNLTSYSARSQMRGERSSEEIAASFTCSVDSDPATGKITMFLSNSVSKDIRPGSYYYDLEIFTANDENVTRILQGRARVTPEVTR